MTRANGVANMVCVIFYSLFQLRDGFYSMPSYNHITFFVRDRTVDTEVQPTGRVYFKINALNIFCLLHGEIRA